MGKYLLGLDAGTSGCKTCIFDFEGNVISVCLQEYPCQYPNPGWVEQKDVDILDGVYGSIKGAIAQAGVDPKEIVAMSMSSQGSVLGPVNERGALMRPFIGWQDTRGIPYVEKLQNGELAVTADEFYDISGNPAGTINCSTKYMWTRDNEPEIWENMKICTLQQDYLLSAFDVEGYYCDTASAGRAGVFNVPEGHWDERLVKMCGLSIDKLPKVVKSGELVGEINKRLSDLTGLVPGTKICVGAMDQNCSTYGGGLVNEGTAVMVMGTYGSIYAGLDKALPDPNRKMILKHNSGKENYTLEGALTTAASCYRWIRDELCGAEMVMANSLQSSAYELMNQQAERIPMGCDGVTFIPYLQGASGSSRDNPYATGAFLGTTMQTTKAHYLRAVMEGVTLAMRDNLEAMRAIVDIKEIRLTGGATKGKLWSQMMADMFKNPVSILQTSETGCLGAALYAGVGAGVYKGYQEAVDTAVKVTHVIDPIPANYEAVDKSYARFVLAYEALDKGGYFKGVASL